MEKCLKLKIFQLHGTGLHYKTHLGGRQGVLRQFPDIEEQIQIKVKIFTFVESNIFLQQTKQTSHNQFPVQPLSISLFQLHLKSFSDFDILHFQDILTNKESRMFIRKHFCAFIRYLEELDPDLTNITSYMRKLDTFLFRILSVILLVKVK